jgi:hypothetical protein
LPCSVFKGCAATILQALQSVMGGGAEVALMVGARD